MPASIGTVSTSSRQKEVEHLVEREKEITRLGEQIARVKGMHKRELMSELLALFGFIHNTPWDRRVWENQ